MTSRAKASFHPFELALCGLSGTGKTTLLSHLAQRLSQDFQVGYLKHGAHDFDLDRPGKDTARLSASGATQVMIQSTHKSAWISSMPPAWGEVRQAFQDCELLLIEGYKHGPSPKLVLLDAAGELLRAVAAGEIQNVLALIGPDLKPSAEVADLAIPYFQRDSLDPIEACVRQHLQALAADIPLYGLVLAGGQSRRMGQDKALLRYGQRTQLEVAYDLLASRCELVFVSVRPEQWQHQPAEIETLPQLPDRFLGFGPLGGILTAMSEEPQAAWLVLACDLPCLNAATLSVLAQNRRPTRPATAFISSSDGLPEPLCAIYEPSMRQRLLAFLAQGYHCPRKALINSPSALLALPAEHQQALTNANTQADYLQVKQTLKEPKA